MKKIILVFLFVIFSLTSKANTIMNPLHYAVSINNLEYVSQLVKEEPLLIQGFNGEGETPVHLSIIENKNEILRNFINVLNINSNLLNRNRESLLITAIKSENITAIDFLLNNNADPYIKDIFGRDSFFYAKQINNEYIFNKLISKEKNNKNQNKEDLLLENFEELKTEFKSFRMETNNNIQNQIDLLEGKIEFLSLKIAQERENNLSENKIEEIIQQNNNLLKTIESKNNDILNLKNENKLLKNEINEVKEFVNSLELLSLLKMIKENSQKIEVLVERDMVRDIYNNNSNVINESPVNNNNLIEVNNNQEEISLIENNSDYTLLEENKNLEVDLFNENSLINMEGFHETISEVIESQNLIDVSEEIFDFEGFYSVDKETKIVNDISELSTTSDIVSINEEHKTDSVEEIEVLVVQEDLNKIVSEVVDFIEEDLNKIVLISEGREIRESDIVQKKIVDREPIFAKEVVEKVDYFSIENILLMTIFVFLVIIMFLIMIIMHYKKRVK